MYALIFLSAFYIALASCCPGQVQTAYDQIQAANSYLPKSSYDQVQGANLFWPKSAYDQIEGPNSYWQNARSRQHIHYGPVFVHNHRRGPFYRSRSEPAPGIHQPYSGEYMTHLLLANQVPGPSNDNMAQLLYDNSPQPQMISSKNAAQLMYDPLMQHQQLYARSMAPQSYLYPGLFTRAANNLDVIYDDNEYVVMPAMTCLH